MVDPAILPDRPVSPKLFKFLVAGIALGLMAGFGAAAAFELVFDHSVKTGQELELLSPLPVLGTVPHLKPRGRLPRGALIVEPTSV